MPAPEPTVPLRRQNDEFPTTVHAHVLGVMGTRVRSVGRGGRARNDARVYSGFVAAEPHLGPVGAPHERMAVVRTFGDVKGLIAVLNAGHPVLAVVRADQDERRVLDLLAGWALGSGGDLDRIGPNTILARPPGSETVRLGRTSLVSAVEEVFANDDVHPLTRQEEARLLPAAVAGSTSARRKLIDAYSDFATVFALRVRPSSVSETAAVRAAQQELERIVTFPSRGPLLASLTDGIMKILLPDDT